MATRDRPSTDWRRPETYAYTDGLTREGWAWEFLRRNRRYRADAAAAARPLRRKREGPPRLELRLLPEAVARARRWGLWFLRKCRK